MNTDAEKNTGIYTESNYRYPGSRPFYDTKNDRSLFFGRDKEVQLLLHETLISSLVVFYAKSGLGKTSLLNAGLSQELRDLGFIPFKARFNDPGVEPMQAIYEGIERTVKQRQLDYEEGEKDSLWQFFKTAAFWGPGNKLLKPVLILDQFEEFFTLHSPQVRNEFTRHLAYLVSNIIPAELAASVSGGEPFPYSNRPPNIKVVISIREDYLGQLEEMYEDIPGILHHRFRLLPLSREQAKQAIVGPTRVKDEAIRAASFTFSPDAVDMMLDFLCKRKEKSGIKETDEVESFQLQLLCRHIEEKVRTKAGRGECEAVVEKGDLGGKAGMQRVLQRFYDYQVRQLSSALTRKRTRRLCEKGLISFDDRRLSLEEGEIKRKFNVSESLLGELVNRRLLRAEPRVGSNYYELSHDTLVAPIRESQRKRRATKTKAGVIILCILVVIAFFSQILLQHRDKGESEIEIAEKRFKQAVEKNEKDVEAYIELARVYHKYTRYKDAVDKYKKALPIATEIKHDKTIIYFELGNVLIKMKKYDEAIENYKKVIKKYQNYLAAYIEIGRAYYFLKTYDKAIENYDKAINIDPTHARAYIRKGEALHKMGKIPEANEAYTKVIEECKKAIKIRPHDTGLYHNMGLALLNLTQYDESEDPKKYDDAINAFKKAIEIDPNFFPAHNYLGTTFRLQGTYHKAIEAFNKAIKLKPDDSYAYNGKGVALSGLGRYDEAIETCKKALDLDPGDKIRKMNLAGYLLIAKRFEEAYSWAEEVLKEKNIPEELKVFMLGVSVASLHLQKKRYEASLKFEELKNYYFSLPEDYNKDFEYGSARKIINKNKEIDATHKTLLIIFIKILESPLKEGRKQIKMVEPFIKQTQ